MARCRQSMSVTFVHVILGRPQPRPPVGTSFWISLVNHRYFLLGRAIWVSRCRVPLPHRQVASSADLVSWLAPCTRHKALCRISEAIEALAQIPGPCYIPCWPEVPFLPYQSSKGSVSLAVPPANHWDNQVICLQFCSTDSPYETLMRGFPEPRWTDQSLGEHPFSHWTRHSVGNQYTLCFWHYHTCSVWPH